MNFKVLYEFMQKKQWKKYAEFSKQKYEFIFFFLVEWRKLEEQYSKEQEILYSTTNHLATINRTASCTATNNQFTALNRASTLPRFI